MLEESQISSELGHCVVIQGIDSCGYILHNAVTNRRGVGVLVCDGGRGVVEGNDICFAPTTWIIYPVRGSCESRLHKARGYASCSTGWLTDFNNTSVA